MRMQNGFFIYSVTTSLANLTSLNMSTLELLQL